MSWGKKTRAEVLESDSNLLGCQWLPTRFWVLFADAVRAPGEPPFLPPGTCILLRGWFWIAWWENKTTNGLGPVLGKGPQKEAHLSWVLKGEMWVLGALRQEGPWPVPRRVAPSAWWGDGGRRGQIARVIKKWNLREHECVCCVLPGDGSDAMGGVDCRGQHGYSVPRAHLTTGTRVLLCFSWWGGFIQMLIPFLFILFTHV